MWQCPKCGLEVEDSLKWCWICGTGRHGTVHADIPRACDVGERFREPPHLMQTIRAVNDAADERVRPAAAGVPRRFSLGRLLLITAFFAALFGVLRCLDAHPVVFIVVAVFFTLVGLAQACLYGGKDPRKASVVAGGVCCAAACMLALLVLFIGAILSPYPPDVPEVLWMVLGLPFYTATAALVGGILGYVAGCLVAAVFLGKRPDLPETDDHRCESPDPLRPDRPNTGPSEDPPGG